MGNVTSHRSQAKVPKSWSGWNISLRLSRDSCHTPVVPWRSYQEVFMLSPIRVVLADDHPFVRAGIRATLAAERDICVVGEASDGDQAQQLCREMQPDIL